MSDFLFVRSRNSGTDCARALSDVACSELAALPPRSDAAIRCYHGEWGALTVRDGHYAGFMPYENNEHVIVVLGGPVLRFRDNNFLSASDSAVASQSILERWLSGDLNPLLDLDGPFAVVIIDKGNGTVHCITDLMLFIPVFAYQFAYENKQDLVVGSHIDVTGKVLVRLQEQRSPNSPHQTMDEAAVADFCLHGAVCYPFTVYSELFQLPPAYELSFSQNRAYSDSEQPVSDDEVGFESRGKPYWTPRQSREFRNLEEAALFVRNGIENYVSTVVRAVTQPAMQPVTPPATQPVRDHGEHPRVAQFISAGEDSRVIAGLLRAHLEGPVQAQVYTDSNNKELKIAKRAADMYGLDFHPVIRDPNHYFNILPDATRLTGSQFQYHHSHPFRVQPDQALQDFRAVFGGFSADALLKGQYVFKNKLVERLRFLPELESSAAVSQINVQGGLFRSDLVAEVQRRRNLHLARVNRIRNSDHLEWYSIWPATMRKALPNVIANRRLFRSYEPFVSNTAVIAAANIPTKWRLNRRVFRTAFHPALKRSKFLRHADGRLPYYPWWANVPGYVVESYRKAWVRRFDKHRPAEGPWCNWRRLQVTAAWQSALTEAEASFKFSGLLRDEVRLASYGHEQQLNVMQLNEILYPKGQKHE